MQDGSATKIIENWQANLSDIIHKPKLRLYTFIKQDFRLEPYLTSVKDFRYINAITKLRASSHNLEIERGRHTIPKTPEHQRVCNYCGDIEDEIHFVCVSSILSRKTNTVWYYQ